ncbi:hypothetical protein OsJ_35214 [Oryza sativa Japonica Group]|uniref:Uncharacterized protein n=1 Tax=Oryza sativa subsp. japonica TaxID=39947 RepID=B9GBV9_ORYSJ|nr:hypothetical protein OsJ_35214 [Oryza sativa Japonica Group]
MDLAAGAVDPPPGSGSGVHDGGGGDSGQRLGRRDEPLWIAAATAHPSEGIRGSGPHAAGSGLPGPNLAGKLQGRRPRLHDNGGGGATARQLRLDGVGVDGAGCGVVCNSGAVQQLEQIFCSIYCGMPASTAKDGNILEHAQTIQNEYYSFSMYNISDT